MLSERVGTPYYVAPEVLLKDYDERCDLWATGVIAYMMMTKKPPFKGENEVDIMQNILTKEPLYSKALYEKYSLESVNFVKHLLVKNPTRRLSIEEAYHHSWLKQKNSNKSILAE